MGTLKKKKKICNAFIIKLATWIFGTLYMTILYPVQTFLYPVYFGSLSTERATNKTQENSKKICSEKFSNLTPLY